MTERPEVALVRDQIEPTVTVKELAKLWNCGPSLIYDGVKNHGWPHRMEARTIKFTVSDIREIREIQRRVIAPRRRAPRRRPSRSAA